MLSKIDRLEIIKKELLVKGKEIQDLTNHLLSTIF